MDYLPSEILKDIFLYLDLKTIAICECVSKTWYEIINTTPSNLFQTLELRYYNFHIDFNFVSSKALNTVNLGLSGTNYTYSQVEQLVHTNNSTLRTLDLSFYRLDYSQLESLFVGLLSLHKVVLAECKLTDTALFALESLPNLRWLNINYNRMLSGTALKELDIALSVLYFDGCEMLEFENAYSVVRRSSDILTDLRIDGENFSTADIVSLVLSAPKLTKFSISFANELGNPLLVHLHNPDWEFLRLRKGMSFCASHLNSLFEVFMHKLTFLDVSECYELDDHCLILISKNCPSLKSFFMCWCSNIKNKGLKAVVNACRELRELDATGLKSITAKSFPLEFELENMRDLNLSQCDNVSDKHLWEMHFKFPKMKIKNYYGEYFDAWKPYESCF